MTLIMSGFTKDESIVFVADSLITTKNSQGQNIKMVDQFRKILPVGIIIRVPELDADNKISGFRDLPITRHMMLSFAGSTLVAQHIINNIQGHFRRLKLVNVGDELRIVPPCDYSKEIIEQLNAKHFAKIDESGLYQHLTKNFVAKLVLHCIQKVVDEGKENIIDAFSAARFKTDFILAFTCGESGKNVLYRYTMEFKDYEFQPMMEEIISPEVAVIGVAKYTKAIKSFSAKHIPKYEATFVLEHLMQHLLKIDELNGWNDIGYPFVTKYFQNHMEMVGKQKVTRRPTDQRSERQVTGHNEGDEQHAECHQDNE